MKLIKSFLTAFLMLSLTITNAQIKNASKITVKIYGNCGMCKANIEKAGKVKKVADVNWDAESKMATLTFNPNKTSQSEILKRIALAGYDSDEFLAPADAYAKLAGCCQYERVNLPMPKTEDMDMEMTAPPMTSEVVENKTSETMPDMDMTVPAKTTEVVETQMPETMPDIDKNPPVNTPEVVENKKPETKPIVNATPSKKPNTPATKPKEMQNVNQLLPVFDAYFAVKDALVKTNGETAASKAKTLMAAIDALKMEALKMEEHTAWMKVMKPLTADAKRMANTTDVAQQRTAFITLSKNMYELIKVSKTGTPVYYQFCPMANNGKGANWLSKENAVKNPYYGSQMLSCGKVVETIK